MSVERMEMMNIIGYLNDMDSVSARIVLNGSVHIVNALNEINQNNFTVIIPGQNADILTDLYYIKQCEDPVDFRDIDNKLNVLADLFNIDRTVKRKFVKADFKYEDMKAKINSTYGEVLDCHNKLDDLDNELREYRRLRENMGYLKSINIDFGVLKGLNFFSFKIGKFTRENYDKLNDNIENISSIIYEISSIPGYQVVISITPKVLEAEVDRVFKSLNFEEISIPYELGCTYEDIMTELDRKIQNTEADISKLNESLDSLKKKYGTAVDESYSRARMYEKILEVNRESACANKFFYMAGWVPVSQKERLGKSLGSFGDRLVLTFKPCCELKESIVPPTKLRNNRFVKPFESLVNMYGLPSYDETDPTFFLAISYMIMFGFMFGDVGQGAVFLIAGIILSKKRKGSNLGGVLSRLGISSMVFGALFGSVFGSEDIIRHPLIRPMQNINTILMAGVVLGVIFITVGYVYSLINASKRRNMEDGVFGKNGLVGMLFFWIMLLTVLFSVTGRFTGRIPMPAVVSVLCVLLLLMVFKEPVTNLLTGRRPLYSQSVQDYYIESGFGMLETLLSMMSNTISFIRVGAFALNHVGLFLAFATISNMIRNSVGSFSVLVLGNIIIIGLEGLIVFIQGLRLEYYELFSKYYEGAGTAYHPVYLKCANQT